jgi:hypothetical protein
MTKLSARPGECQRIGVRLPAELREQLDTLAASHRLLISSMIRKLIREALACPPDKKMARESCELSEPGTPENGVGNGARIHRTAVRL